MGEGERGTGLKGILAGWTTKWKLVVLPAILKLGFLGAGTAALLDSSSIPVPMDLFIAGWVWADRGHFWAYCLLAAVGSSIGGLVPYWIGRAGGELFLLKRINRRRFDELRHRFERQEFLAVMIPSCLPPPTPWKLFVFSAGVFEMPVPAFMLSVFCGRMIRWVGLSLLVIDLGPGVVDVVAHHALTAFLVACGLAAIALAWWVRRGRKRTPRSS
ncbi:MAG TPA: VTT domain-containing protein [Terracidiphilus sp.]|nr:VTT domain-containing protein [Terracidiphilus sp.]